MMEAVAEEGLSKKMTMTTTTMKTKQAKQKETKAAICSSVDFGKRRAVRIGGKLIASERGAGSCLEQVHFRYLITQYPIGTIPMGNYIRPKCIWACAYLVPEARSQK
jgi:hypothetical protein